MNHFCFIMWLLLYPIMIEIIEYIATKRKLLCKEEKEEDELYKKDEIFVAWIIIIFYIVIAYLIW